MEGLAHLAFQQRRHGQLAGQGFIRHVDDDGDAGAVLPQGTGQFKLGSAGSLQAVAIKLTRSCIEIIDMGIAQQILIRDGQVPLRRALCCQVVRQLHDAQGHIAGVALQVEGDFMLAVLEFDRNNRCGAYVEGRALLPGSAQAVTERNMKGRLSRQGG